MITMDVKTMMIVLLLVALVILVCYLIALVINVIKVVKKAGLMLDDTVEISSIMASRANQINGGIDNVINSFGDFKNTTKDKLKSRGEKGLFSTIKDIKEMGCSIKQGIGKVKDFNSKPCDSDSNKTERRRGKRRRKK